MTRVKSIQKHIKRIIYIILPFVILYFILKKADIPLLIQNIKNANPIFIITGILFRPLQIVLGSIRWQLMNHFYCKEKLPGPYMTFHYWAGLAIGYFTPGNLGWDAYRVVTAGKKMKAYTAAFITVVSEKFVGLFSVTFMILAIFPFVAGKMTTDTTFLTKSYLLLITITILIAITFIALIRNHNHQKLRFIKDLPDKIVFKFIDIIKNQEIKRKIEQDYKSSANIFSIGKEPTLFLGLFSLSIFILVVAAISSQLIFKGLEYDISFIINLFAAPVFYILFFIPISFGSIGVREVAFILVYGLFGVPLEIALLVSFFNLFGLILNTLIGALLIFIKGLQKNVV